MGKIIMETLMSKDFESRFFDLLMDRLDKQDKKLEEIHTQVKKTNGRVTLTEKDIDKLKAAKNRPFALTPTVLNMIAIAAVLLLGIIAAVLKVPLEWIGA